VIDIIIGEELEDAGVNHLPCACPMTNRDGTERADPKRPILCVDTVRYVGDNVAFIVAETPSQARDAAELMEVDYGELRAVVDTATADTPGHPLVHDAVERNLIFDWEFGDSQAVEAAFTSAAHVTTVELINNRVVANPIEPRAGIADYDQASGSLTLYTNSQGGWHLKSLLANDILKVHPEQVRVVTPDVGGGFGMKGVYYPEHVMLAWAARKLGRPVKWTSERAEGFLSDTMGRDHVTLAELAFDADQRIVGMRVCTRANMGAYLSRWGPGIPTGCAVQVLPGVYDVKNLYYRVKGVATNTVPVDAYRGAGRAEAIYVIERLMDIAARELNVDPTDLRRSNFIPASAMPFTTAAGQTYDTGEFTRVLDTALEKADWKGFAERKLTARRRGALRGFGLCYYIESIMGNSGEGAAIRFEKDGSVSLYVGTQSNGQGHETVYAQIVHEYLGVPLESVRVVQGDTDRIPRGGGTGGSSSVTVQGWALHDASRVVIERGKHLAAYELETAVEDIGFDAGCFRVLGTDRAIDIMALAEKAGTMSQLPEGFESGLDGEATIDLKAWSFPNGCHIAEVEIDEETGATRLVRYTVVVVFGKVVNPPLLEGQMHGGVVQGVGQALMEHTVYDEHGQLLTGSFIDYCMPRADDVPIFDFTTIEVPCLNNPLGMKGAGEAGTLGSPAAVINAIVNALADAGIRNINMPTTPMKVWRALHGAGEKGYTPRNPYHS
jgi:carbon-monoxide dehydrogenase large subunit